jgi:hypothetical protein
MALATHEVQQLNQAIQAAMRAVRAGGPQPGGFGPQLGVGFGKPGGDGAWEQQLSDFARERMREAVRERVTETAAERLIAAGRKRTHEVVRRRLADDIRAALIEGQSGQDGFDFERVETKLSELFGEALHDRFSRRSGREPARRSGTD